MRLTDRHDVLLSLLEEQREGRDAEAEARAIGALAPLLQAFIAECRVAGARFDEYGDRTTVQAMIDYWANILRRAGRPIEYVRIDAFDPAQLPTLADAECPYPGADPIRTPKWFFGREPQVKAALERLEREPILAIRGPGGCGKSSLLHAGLLPGLRERGGLVVSMRPGAKPFVRLAAALSQALEAEHSEAQLRAPGMLTALLADRPATILAIDQFEEFFILTGHVERNDFDKLLEAFLTAKPGNRLVLCVNDGLIEHIEQMPKLAARLDPEHSLSLAALDGPQIEDAILRPALEARLELKPGVLEYLVRELRGDPAALPLLQFMMGKLWSVRDHNRITVEGMQSLGAEPKALFDAEAERRYDAIRESAKEQDIRRLLLELIRIDSRFDYHRRPRRLEPLLDDLGAGAGRKLIDTLVEQGFIRVIDDEIVELAGEAYIHHWRRLVDWSKAQRKPSSSLRAALADAAQLWDQAGRPGEGLYRPPQIRRARAFEGLSELERQFLTASEEAIEREQAQRDLAKTRQLQLLSGAVVLLVLCVVAVGVALWQERQKSALDRALADKKTELEAKKAELEAKNAELETKEEDLEAKNAELAAKKAETADLEGRKRDLQEQIVNFESVVQQQIRSSGEADTLEPLLETLERDALSSLESDKSGQISKRGNYWLQVASDESMRAAEQTLTGLLGRRKELGLDERIYFMILERGRYHVLMVGGYPTAEAAKAVAKSKASTQLYTHGIFVRSLATFCPDRTPLDTPREFAAQDVAVARCDGE